MLWERWVRQINLNEYLLDFFLRQEPFIDEGKTFLISEIEQFGQFYSSNEYLADMTMPVIFLGREIKKIQLGFLGQLVEEARSI